MVCPACQIPFEQAMERLRFGEEVSWGDSMVIFGGTYYDGRCADLGFLGFALLLISNTGEFISLHEATNNETMRSAFVKELLLAALVAPEEVGLEPTPATRLTPDGILIERYGETEEGFHYRSWLIDQNFRVKKGEVLFPKPPAQ